MLAILVSVSVGTAGQIFLKIGAAAETAARVASATPVGEHATAVLPAWALGLLGPGAMWVWGSAALNLVGMVAWIRAIRVIPLGVAFALSQVMHAMVPLSCWLFLGEAVRGRRWWGIGLIFVGLLVVARPYARLDQKMEGRGAQ